MKSFCLLLLVAASLWSQPAAAQSNGLVWYTDLMQAQQQSLATHKPIFAFFTGSDWCGWCHKLQNEVFSKTAFVNWAREKVILLELDFPRQKKLSLELTQQNASLQQTFQVGGFPTIWIFFMNKIDTTNQFTITPLGSLGYPRGPQPGKEEVKFLEEAEAIMAKKGK